MRVISGSKKGFRLKRPKSLKIRPTQDRVKESLFNILGYINNGSTILDLFAGSGSIGIEFLSRGASKCFFVDVSKDSIRTINKNLAGTKLKDKALVYKKDALSIIKLFGEKKIQFDYIYIDPPYCKYSESVILKNIGKKDILKQAGIVIVEHDKKRTLEGDIGTLKRTDSRRYGDTSLTFYKRN